MFLDNLINRLKLITPWMRNKTYNVSPENEFEELQDIDAVLLSDPEYLRYIYEIDYYGADYHDKLRNYHTFLESRKNIEYEHVASVEEITRALLILNIQSRPIITASDINTAYYKALAKYEPKHSNAWPEMWKMITVANDVLSSQSLLMINEIANKNFRHYGYAENINAALNKIIYIPDLCIDVWDLELRIRGNTKEHYKILKQVGFCQHKDNSCWTFLPLQSVNGN